MDDACGDIGQDLQLFPDRIRATVRDRLECEHRHALRLEHVHAAHAGWFGGGDHRRGHIDPKPAPDKVEQPVCLLRIARGVDQQRAVLLKDNQTIRGTQPIRLLGIRDMQPQIRRDAVQLNGVTPGGSLAEINLLGLAEPVVRFRNRQLDCRIGIRQQIVRQTRRRIRWRWCCRCAFG